MPISIAQRTLGFRTTTFQPQSPEHSFTASFEFLDSYIWTNYWKHNIITCLSRSRYTMSAVRAQLNNAWMPQWPAKMCRTCPYTLPVRYLRLSIRARRTFVVCSNQNYDSGQFPHHAAAFNLLFVPWCSVFGHRAEIMHFIWCCWCGTTSNRSSLFLCLVSKRVCGHRTQDTLILANFGIVEGPIHRFRTWTPILC